jgi:hypothetical protein
MFRERQRKTIQGIVMTQKKLFEPGTFVSTFSGQAGIVLSEQGLEKVGRTYREGKRPGYYFAPGCCQNPDYVLQVPVLFEDRTFDIMRATSIRRNSNITEEKQMLLKTLIEALG